MSKQKPARIVPRLRFAEFLNEEAWSERKLGEIGNFVGGGTPSTSNPKYWNGNIQWYTPKEIKNRMLKPSMRTISKDGLKNSSAKLLPKGTILITTRATIGDVAIANKECATNQGFQSLVINETEVNLFWYYWILLHKNELIKRSSGSTFKEIRKTKIEVIPTFSPNKKEQQKIAACLTALDDLISAATGRLSALKQHKQGLMQQLFPTEGETVPRLRFPEFRDAGGWSNSSLEELYSFKATNSFSREQLNYEIGEVKNIHYGDVHTKFSTSFYIKEESVPFINPTEYLGKIKHDCYCEEGDMIFADASEDLNDVGKSIEIVSLNNEKLLSGLHTLLARQKKSRLVIGFGRYLFKSSRIRAQIKREAQGAKVLGISAGRISRIDIAFPSNKEEQQKIAACLTALDDLIAAQTQKIAKLKTHKRGLMQQLFPTVDETH